jgi:short-subunit dehydrogenase
MSERRTAFVSGATGGIGAEFCRAYAARGYNLIVTGRQQAALDALKAALEGAHRIEIETHAADLTDRHQVEALAERLASIEPLDVLINNAGMIAPGPFTAYPLATHLGMVELHVSATTRFCRAALPGMLQRRRGNIINVSSLGGLVPEPSDVLYSATKQFIVHFSRSIAAAAGPAGVRVQALCPGFTRTKIHDAVGTTAFIPPMLWMSPRDVVAESLQSLGSPRVVCIPGRLNRVFARLLPHPSLLRRAIGLAASIDKRRGWGRKENHVET